jgi:hypothetical protein
MIKNPPLGCLTTSGLIGALLTVLIVTGFAFANNGILFSPGALNAQIGVPLGGVSSHAEISSRCSRCHTPFWGTVTMADRCMECHTDVAAQWQDPSTLHGGLRQNNPTVGCRGCHPDHRGPNAPLTTINHNLFAFKLTGKHASIPCASCHINNIFKNTPSDCYSCHQKDDQHKSQFGKNCGSCHSTSGWTPANFDHSRSGFPLTGAHTNLNCTQCHTSKVFTGLSTTCVACHAEPSIHAGVFGTDCAQCHTTNNWKATFNHPNGCGEVNCVNHENATCVDCHPVNYSNSSCTKCHDSNSPGGGGD